MEATTTEAVMSKLETMYVNQPSPLGEADERAALAGEGQPSTRPSPLFSFDGTLVAMAVGLALWFVCAALVISTFAHPGAPRVPAVNPHGGHSLLIAVSLNG
jgi:hypothetical protein